MTFIPNSKWNQYKNIIDEFFDDIAEEGFIWKKNTIGFGRYQEGNKTHVEVSLRGLFEYPYQRKWPIDVVLPEGQDDKMYSGLYLNYTYLEQLGLIENGHFKFDAARDRFQCRGIEYKCYGDTAAGQAKDRPLYIMLILERTELESHS